MALALKRPIMLCDVLFTAAIILDLLAALDAIAPLIFNEEADKKNSLTMGSNRTRTEVKEWLSEETTAVEMFAHPPLHVLLSSTFPPFPLISNSSIVKKRQMLPFGALKDRNGAHLICSGVLLSSSFLSPSLYLHLRFGLVFLSVPIS